MKHTITKITFSFIAALSLAACTKDNPNPTEPRSESKYIRVLVADGNSNTLTQVNPTSGQATTFEAPHPNAALYRTASGRYAALLHGNHNFAQFFDTGLEYHGDHVDVKGTPKFAAITSTGARPSHFKSHGAESMVFNDGDGTLSVANEADFHTPGAKMRVIQAGLAPHHGAMAKFTNGNYAITTQDVGSPLGGPHGVKIINGNGEQVHPATLPVSRLHGNATDGANAVFGVEGGVLVVAQNGQQRVIPNLENWGTTRFGTILYAEGANKFLGYTNLKGVYTINLAANSITPIFEGTTIMQAKLDLAGQQLLVLLLDGTLHVYDAGTGALKKSGNVISATASTETFKPVLEATANYAYIAVPSLGELHQINLHDLADVTKHQVSAQPTRLAVLGHDTDESH